MTTPLRIATINTNGIRAAYRKGMGAWLDGRGVDILAYPFSRFLSVIHVWAMSRMEEKDGAIWKAKLDAPIPAVEKYLPEPLMDPSEFDQFS